MKTFIVLEDEPLIAMDLQIAFEDAGQDCVCAIDNTEALACIEEHDIAGAVLDVTLGGGQTCEKTAMKLSELGIPFILHTGDLDRAGEHLRRFDVPIIAKPRPSDSVAKAIIEIVDTAEAEGQNQEA